jgi:Flp pilus assembly pilin Flp
MRPLLAAMSRLDLTIFTRDERGQDLLEYALLVALIVIVAVAGVTLVGNTINDVFWNAIAATV